MAASSGARRTIEPSKRTYLLDSDRNKRRKVQPKAEAEDLDVVTDLENGIMKTRTNYNDIAKLLSFADRSKYSHEIRFAALLSLCRIFGSFLSSGKLQLSKHLSESEKMIVRWLRSKCDEYKANLVETLAESESESQVTALQLLLHMIKEEGQSEHGVHGKKFPRKLMNQIVESLISAQDSSRLRHYFVEQYVNVFDDIRYFTLWAVQDILSSQATSQMKSTNAVKLLQSIRNLPSKAQEISSFYIPLDKTVKSQLNSIAMHKKKFQAAWLSVMQLDLMEDDRKEVLARASEDIAPHFLDPELLMDFFTDSFNCGGSISVLALSGMFYMIQERNLDYPSFYTKLYSLVDPSILHSRHRSQFFKLLETCLGSTHLPAVMIASFIKRLSRLTLFAPPAAIIVVIPLIYNLFKAHPSCTFMMHRVISDQASKLMLEQDGFKDLFLAEEADPMETRAINSSIWELHTQQSHYHPNVAILAKILSEQFTKPNYNVEDFLDHSYSTILDSELSKPLTRAPVVEFEISKNILVKNDVSFSANKNHVLELWSSGK